MEFMHKTLFAFSALSAILVVYSVAIILIPIFVLVGAL